MSSLESPSVSLSKLESHRKSLRMFSQNHKSHPTQFNGPKWPNHTHAPLVLRTPSQFLAQERLWLSCTDTLWNANLRSSLSPSPGHHSPSQKNLFLLFLHSLFLSLCPQLIYPIGQDNFPPKGSEERPQAPFFLARAPSSCDHGLYQHLGLQGRQTREHFSIPLPNRGNVPHF